MWPQRVAHYELAGYGCARTYAQLLGGKRGAKMKASGKKLPSNGITETITRMAEKMAGNRLGAVKEFSPFS